jgi:environmental stress-induced protein Ves
MAQATGTGPDSSGLHGSDGARDPHDPHDPHRSRDGMRCTVLTLLPGAALVAAPWKNGGGVTREIAAGAPAAGMDGFAWRISLADVAQAGPFSRFPGVDRTLVLLSGAGMTLTEAGEPPGRTHRLRRPLDIARFAGESAIDASLEDGPTRDFNLMLSREQVRGELDVWRAGAAHTLDGDVVLLFCAGPAATVSLVSPGGAVAAATAPATLSHGDTLRLDAPRALRCTVAGGAQTALLAISIRCRI